MAKILQIGMIPHNMTLFKFICVQYQFHRQTLSIMKIDRGQIQFREYVSTGTEPIASVLDLQMRGQPEFPAGVKGTGDVLSHLCTFCKLTSEK